LRVPHGSARLRHVRVDPAAGVDLAEQIRLSDDGSIALAEVLRGTGYDLAEAHRGNG